MIKILGDPGHGGRYPGGAANGLQEKDIVLKIGLMIADMVKSYDGVEYRNTRSMDVFLTLQERVNLADSWGAD